MTDNSYEQAEQPNPDLKTLERLVGTWNVTGGAHGVVTYEWMEGGFFMMQHFNLIHDGRKIKGIEIIGHLQVFGEKPSEDIKSRVYDTVGNTLDYVYEVTDDTLMIWGGEKGSPAYFKGTFSPDGNTCAGAWVFPGGGGYDATMTRKN